MVKLIVGGTNMTQSNKKEFSLFGLPWYIFAIFSAIVLIAVFMERLPSGMIGAVPVLVVFGVVFNEIGDRTPFVNTFLGGGAIVAIFGSATLNFLGFFPESTIVIIENFMKDEGFLNFYIAALITGSILGMNRDLLVKAAVRYLPAIIGGVAVAIALTGLVGALIGYGAKDAILYITIPIMGGGMGAGAVPLSKIFGESLGVSPESMLSVMVPAVALGNAMAIVVGGLLNKLGKVKPSLTGNGNLLINKAGDKAVASDETEDNENLEKNIQLRSLGTGMFVATTFYALGMILAKVIPGGIHNYAWMIISVAIIKILGVMPRKIEVACFQWYRFIMINGTAMLLVGIGLAYTDLGQVIDAFSIRPFQQNE